MPILYVPSMQQPERSMTIVARLEPGAAASVIDDGVAAVEPHQPLFDVRMMEDWVDRLVAAPRFNLLLLGLFAVLGVTLAAVGVYGVMAFTVSRRTRELGIRIALGAEPSALLRLVLGRSVLMAVAGVVAGLAAGLGTALLLRTMFHGVQILDPLVLATVSALVVGVSLLASYIPARRAMRIDPLEALRAGIVPKGIDRADRRPVKVFLHRFLDDCFVGPVPPSLTIRTSPKSRANGSAGGARWPFLDRIAPRQRQASPSASSSMRSRRTVVLPWSPHAPAAGTNTPG